MNSAKRHLAVVASLMIALVLLFASLTFPVSTHYCHGEAVNVRLFAQAPTCDGRMPPPEHRSIQSCCSQNESLFSQEEPVLSAVPFHPVTDLVVLPAFSWPEFVLPVFVTDSDALQWRGRAPPLLPQQQIGLVLFYQNILV